MPTDNPCDGCPHHENVEWRLKSHTDRLDAHGDKLDKMDEVLVRLTALMERQEERMDDVEDDVDEIKMKPARQMTTAQNVALTVLVTAVINAMLQSWQYF